MTPKRRKIMKNNITINTKELEAQVRNTSKACGKSPMDDNAVELAAKDGVLTIYGGSSIMTVKSSIPYEGEAEFTVVVGSDLLLNTLSKMKALGDFLTIDVDKQVTLTCGSAKVNISILANAVITKRGEDTDYAGSTTVPGLCEMVMKTAHALAPDGQGDPKMSVFDIKMGKNDGEVMVTTLDGHRISSRATVDTPANKELLVYGKPFLAVMQMLDSNEEVKLSFPEKEMFIKVEGSGIEATVSVLGGQYYNLDPLMNVVGESVTFQKDKMQEALSLAGLFGRKAKVVMQGSQMVITAIAETTNGNTQICVPCTGEVKTPITFGVSNLFMTDALKALDKDEITFTITSPRTPMKLSDGEGVVEIILPIALSA